MWYRDASRYALNSGAGRTGDLIIADWHDIEHDVTSEVHVKKIQVQRSWNQEVAGCMYISLHRWFPDTRRSRTKSNFSPPKNRQIRRGESARLWSRRGVVSCSLQGVTLRNQHAELRTFLKLIATLWGRGENSGVCLVTLFHATTLS